MEQFDDDDAIPSDLLFEWYDGLVTVGVYGEVVRDAVTLENKVTNLELGFAIDATIDYRKVLLDLRSDIEDIEKKAKSIVLKNYYKEKGVLVNDYEN